MSTNQIKSLEERVKILERIKDQHEIGKITNGFLEKKPHNFRKPQTFSDETYAETKSCECEDDGDELGTLIVHGGINVAKNILLKDETAASGTVAGSISTLGGINAGGNLIIRDTTAASETETGSVLTLGGVNVTKNIIVQDTTAASGTEDLGSILTKGGVNVEKNLHVGGTTNANNTGTGTIVASGSIYSETTINAKSEIQQYGYQLVPPGCIMQYAAVTAPSGWLLCDGSSVSISSYPLLYNVIGSTYGPDGEGEFTLPDFRGRVPKGSSGAVGTPGGSTTAILSTSNLPDHVHTGTTDAVGNHTHEANGTVSFTGSGTPGSIDSEGSEINTTQTVQTTTDPAGGHSHTFSTSGTTGASASAFSIEQPYLVVSYIIKY